MTTISSVSSSFCWIDLEHPSPRPATRSLSCCSSDPRPALGVGSPVPRPSQVTGTCRQVDDLSLVATLTLAVALWTSCSLVNQELPNESPVVQVRMADTTVVARGGRVELTVTASDEDDDPLRYEWSAGGAGSFTDSLASATHWIAPTQIFGRSEFFLISVTITDSQPETKDPVETFLIEVVQRPPVLTAPGDTLVSFRDPEIVLEASATDQENDVLTFEWEVLEEGGLSADQLSLQTQSRDGATTLRMLPLVPGEVAMSVFTTDGTDTIRSEFTVEVTAPDLPEGGTVSLSLPATDGSTHNYEIDVYEYPNQKGVAPLLVDSWFEAQTLCLQSGMRLCSREEWVNACQGPDNRSVSSVDDRDVLPEEFGLRFCNEVGSGLWGGDDQNLEDVAPSGSFPNCTSGTGAYDLTGNAFEWMQVWVPPAAEAVTLEGVGRAAAFSFSSTIFSGFLCGQTSTLGVMQLQGDLPQPTPQAFIDSVLSESVDPAFVDSARTSPVYSDYLSDASGLRYGFRCCR